MSKKVKKTEMNRRQFLMTTTGAAAGVATLQGAEALAAPPPEAFRSPNGSFIPYSQKDLFSSQAKQRVFTGDQLQEVAFPLGGIGTGTVSLGGRGQLRDWEIFNRPAKRRLLPSSFVLLWTRPEGGDAAIRVVEGPVQPPYRGWNGSSRISGEGLPHFDKATFTGAYPFAKVDFEDESLPVTASLEAFTPFIPLNIDDSSLPVAIFHYRITSRSKKPVEAALAFSLMNAVGYDGKAHLEDSQDDNVQFSGLGKNINKVREETIGGVKVVGVDMTSGKYGPEDILNGSMALLTTTTDHTVRTNWGDPGWWDPYQKWLNEIRVNGEVHDSQPSEPTPDGRSTYATLAPRIHLAPGESKTVTFVMAWYFPLRENYWHEAEQKEIAGKKLRNDYGTRFKSAWEVATHTAARLPELEKHTRSYQDALFSSSLPAYVLDAVSSQTSTMRSNTCLLLEGKQFFGFEGCADDEALGWMNCNHVWNYEQTVAFLYPELARSVRHTDFTYEVREDGSLPIRTIVPVELGQWTYRPAADGQMGAILKLYREWQHFGDDAFLKRYWPQAKRVLEFAWAYWDADKDGVMEGEQHNTYDIELFGPNPMMTILYLAALKAGELMATAVGDSAAAESYRTIREKGVHNLEDLWNGEFYIQKITPVDQIRTMEKYADKKWPANVVDHGEIKYQVGEGCLSDQMLGQWFAEVVGLDIGLNKERVRKALHSIYRHNFRNDFYKHISAQRLYVLNDDKGLLICTWPNGGRPTIPLVYGDEVWTGIEYQVAAHLIYEGMLEEGLSMVKAVRDRYDGIQRNPWAEVEWGTHYTRAMASWSVLLALSGFRYSAVEKSVSFNPRINDNDFQCFFVAGAGWGVYRQQKRKSTMSARLDNQYGELRLLHLNLGRGLNVPSYKVNVTGPDGMAVAGCMVKLNQGAIQVDLPNEIVVSAGKSITVALEAVKTA